MDEHHGLEVFAQSELESQKAARARTHTIRLLALAVVIAIGGLVFTNRRLERRLDETEQSQVCRIGVTDRGFIAQADTVAALGEVIVTLVLHPVGDPERNQELAETVPLFTSSVATLREENAKRLEASKDCAE